MYKLKDDLHEQDCGQSIYKIADIARILVFSRPPFQDVNLVLNLKTRLPALHGKSNNKELELGKTDKTGRWIWFWTR